MRHLTLLLLLLMPLAVDAQPLPVPPGYLRQALEPTGGEIARPIDWFFRSDETPSGWLWTLSKEDPAQGPYLTGQRIQLLVGVEASSGLTRAAFARQYLDDRRKGARVVRECPATDQGEFYRRCLEVVQTVDSGKGPRAFRILYSMMWGKRMDLVVSSTFGAPEETWKEASRLAGPMTEFRLINGDTERWVSKATHIRSWGGDKPGPIGEVFNVVSASPQDRVRDERFKRALGPTYRFRDIGREGTGYAAAKPIAGGLPTAAYAIDGAPLTGEATVAYLITVEGLAVEPRLVDISDERLRPTVLAAVRAWRFEPATVGGKPVASLAGQEFRFTRAKNRSKP